MRSRRSPPGIRFSGKYERLYHYTSVRVTYDFGDQKETLDGSVINNWLNVDEDGTVTLDSDAVAEYVYGLAQKYDTYGKTRSFKTHDGSTVEVSGGAYGWLIDQNAENEQLLSILKDGLQVEREPVYAQTASTRRNCDLGKFLCGGGFEPPASLDVPGRRGDSGV
ncbi:MAG: peptidoglycan binding domain-containing protein [Lachnospiraceae bacterium]